jgi:hypothetical protein
MFAQMARLPFHPPGLPGRYLAHRRATTSRDGNVDRYQDDRDDDTHQEGDDCKPAVLVSVAELVGKPCTDE